MSSAKVFTTITVSHYWPFHFKSNLSFINYGGFLNRGTNRWRWRRVTYTRCPKLRISFVSLVTKFNEQDTFFLRKEQLLLLLISVYLFLYFPRQIKIPMVCSKIGDLVKTCASHWFILLTCINKHIVKHNNIVYIIWGHKETAPKYIWRLYLTFCNVSDF